MAAIPVTIIGTLTGKDGSENVTLVGVASLSDVGVGGGPIMPPSGGPPSIWPSPGHPAHPIVIPPEIWPKPPDPDAPRPEHPIVIPHPPEIQGPDLEVKTIWTPGQGWQVVLVPTGEHVTPSGRQGGTTPGRRG